MILGIYGAGALGREVLEIALVVNNKENRWEKICYLLDEKYITQRIKDGIDVISPNEFAKLDSDKEAVLGIGEPMDKKAMAEKLAKLNINLAKPIIHPNSNVSPFAQIGDGTVVCFGSNVSFESKVGNNVYLQPNSGIGHNVVVGDQCVISANVRIAGYTEIGECTYVGLSAAIKDQLHIGARCIISMGSIVQRDIEDDKIVMGNPARVIKNNDEHKVF